MSPTFRRAGAVLAVALAAALPFTAQAHRTWLLPSATVLSGDEPWVTVDAAASNDLFYFEHQPIRLNGLVVTAPDGQPAKAEHESTGRYRSSFDVKLTQPGTYRIAVVNQMLLASYEENGETKRARGTAESLKKEIPAGAKILGVSQNVGRIETFVTVGAPSEAALKPTGSGIELVPVTHPNDVVTGTPAKFRFLVDGKPAVGYPVSLVSGGIRYRDKLGDVDLTTDAQGEIEFSADVPGMYWINVTPPRPAGAPGGPGGAGGPPPAAGGASAPGPRPMTGGTLEAPLRRASYSLTFEVLPE